LIYVGGWLNIVCRRFKTLRFPHKPSHIVIMGNYSIHV